MVICKTQEEAHAAIAGLFSGQLLGTPEHSVLIEEFLDGEELSFLVISDGKHAAPLAPAQDHKRIGEGDTGPNTGGMGAYCANDILSAAGVSGDIRIKDLSEDDVRKISRVIEEQGNVEGDLRKEVSMNIKRLMEIGSWRGLRHRRNLPVRGQRTKTNARTRKGPRRGAVAKKKTV